MESRDNAWRKRLVLMTVFVAKNRMQTNARKQVTYFHYTQTLEIAREKVPQHIQTHSRPEYTIDATWLLSPGLSGDKRWWKHCNSDNSNKYEKCHFVWAFFGWCACDGVQTNWTMELVWRECWENSVFWRHIQAVMFVCVGRQYVWRVQPISEGDEDVDECSITTYIVRGMRPL